MFILSVLEVSLSFDNAVVNAVKLEHMTPKWQHRFITWGILIAVFGMRLLFPIIIVSTFAQVKIIETANEMSREISKGTKEYADNLLGGTENVLTDTLAKLEQNMSQALNLMQISMEDTIKTIQNSRKELK